MNDALQKGIAALKAGNTEEARKQFSLALDDNKDDERVWGWVYNAAKDDRERVYCLNQIIRINPNNEKAKKLLDEFNKDVSKKTSDIEPPLEMPKRPSQPIQSVTTKNPSNTKTVIGMIVGVIAFLCLCVMFSSLSTASKSVFSSESNITYKVSGTSGSVHVNYTNATGGDDSFDVSLPYKHDVKIKKDKLVFLTAMPNDFNGRVTCEIWVDGVMVDTKTATNTIVSCSNFLK